MQEKYVNSFIEAFSVVLETFSCDKPVFGEIKSAPNFFETKDISVMIGFIGDISGNTYLSMDNETCVRLATIMLGGIKINEIDEIASSAISELSNMIMGNSCSSISSNNVNIDITPPTVIIGEKITVCNRLATYSVPIWIDNIGNIDFDISFKQ